MTNVRFVRFEDRCDVAYINPAHVSGISETSSADDGECVVWCLGSSFVVKGAPEEVAAKLMGGWQPKVEISQSPDHDTRYMFVFDTKDESAVEEAFQALLGLAYGESGVDPNTKDAYLGVLDKAKKWDALQEAQTHDPE